MAWQDHTFDRKVMAIVRVLERQRRERQQWRAPSPKRAGAGSVARRDVARGRLRTTQTVQPQR